MTNRIAQLRKERSLSQAQLAEALEVTHQTVISLESGRYNASLLLSRKIPRYFGLAIEDIFLFTVKSSRKSAFGRGFPGCIFPLAAV